MTVRAVRDVLLSHGWEGDAADAAAAGLEFWTHHLQGLTPEQIEGLLRAAPRFSADLVTGPDWALLAGTRSRLSSLARSWSLPPELYELVVAIGTGLPADPAPFWRAGETVLDLSIPVVITRLPANAVRATADRAIVGSSESSRAEGESSLAGELSSRAEGEGSRTGGLLITATSADTAIPDLTEALDRALVLGLDPETIAIDPGWAPPLARFRRFGRPIVCTSDDPVHAVLARLNGAQIFVTSAPEEVRRALDLVEHA